MRISDWSSDVCSSDLNPPFELPLGSGPYRVDGYEPGRSVTYRRVEDYWGSDVPAMRGRWNVDVIRYEYFRDRDIATEAFKAGTFDLRAENSAKRWATAFDFPAIDAGMVVKEAVPDHGVAPMRSEEHKYELQTLMTN